MTKGETNQERKPMSRTFLEIEAKRIVGHGSMVEARSLSFYMGVLRLLEDTQWRPIETAPRDGTELFCWDGTHAIYFWDEGQGWCGTEPGTCASCRHPTHWMPLPTPPETER